MLKWNVGYENRNSENFKGENTKLINNKLHQNYRVLCLGQQIEAKLYHNEKGQPCKACEIKKSNHNTSLSGAFFQNVSRA